MMRWLVRLAFIGLGAAVIGLLWSRMNADDGDDDFDDEIPLDFELPSDTDTALSGSNGAASQLDTGDGPGADLQPPAPAVEAPTEAAKSANAGGPDDLTLIRGIGPVFQKRLQDAGVKTFQQLADMTPAQLEAAGIEGVGVDLDSWIEQARQFDASRTG